MKKILTLGIVVGTFVGGIALADHHEGMAHDAAEMVAPNAVAAVEGAKGVVKAVEADAKAVKEAAKTEGCGCAGGDGACADKEEHHDAHHKGESHDHKACESGDCGCNH
jgi:hypothetical protein